MSLEGTTGPGTSPIAFPPAPLMPVPGEDERSGSRRSLRDAAHRGERLEVVRDDVPDEPVTAGEVLDAARIGTDGDAADALARLRPDHRED